MRTAQGWMLRFSGGECKRVQDPAAGCGAHTFVAEAALLPVGGSFARSRNRVFLHWQLEPGVAIGCQDGIVFDPQFQFPTEGAAARST